MHLEEIAYHFRPYLSAARPKVIAPTDRSMRTSVIPQVMSALVFLKVVASGVTTRDTVKKSNASQVHAKKATRKNIHCCKLSRANVLNGFAILRIGGFRLVIRVAAYLPIDTFPCSEYSLGDSARVALAILRKGSERRNDATESCRDCSELLRKVTGYIWMIPKEGRRNIACRLSLVGTASDTMRIVLDGN